jgi:hypothetical protein
VRLVVNIPQLTGFVLGRLSSVQIGDNIYALHALNMAIAENNVGAFVVQIQRRLP